MRFTLATCIVVLAPFAAASGVSQAAEKRSGIAIPITKRSNLANADKVVDIDALRNDAASIKAKTLRGLEMYERNTGEAHPFVVEGVQKRALADALIDSNDQLWMGDVSVGTPGQSFLIDFDTGSCDFFVPASTCHVNCDGHTLWDPAASSTSKELYQHFGLLYGDNTTVAGILYNDTVSLAGLTATEQTVGAAMNYSAGFAKSKYAADGLMGFGFQAISSFNATPVFHTLVAQGQVADPAFSFKLAQNGSELFLGGSNRHLFKGSFTHAPVLKEAYWTVKMDNIIGGNQTILEDIIAIIDTGTTLVVGIPSDVDKLYKELHGKAATDIGKGFYTFECDNFPEISLTFGNRPLRFAPENLNLGAVSESSSECVSAIVGLDTGIKAWSIGDAFLRGFYTRFDLGKDGAGSFVAFADLA